MKKVAARVLQAKYFVLSQDFLPNRKYKRGIEDNKK